MKSRFLFQRPREKLLRRREHALGRELHAVIAQVKEPNLVTRSHEISGERTVLGFARVEFRETKNGEFRGASGRRRRDARVIARASPICRDRCDARDTVLMTGDDVHPDMRGGGAE